MNTNLPRLLLKILMDFTALLVAFTSSFFIAQAISQVGRGVPYLSWSSPHVTNHAIIFCVFALAMGFTMYSRGHYTQRLPWWHQVYQVIVIAILAMLVQGFLHYLLQYPLSRLWVGVAWSISVPLILIARLIVRQILLATGSWNIPTILIGGRENLLETVYALHSDPYAGFDLKKIILLSDSTLTPDHLPPRFRNVEIVYGTRSAFESFQEVKNGKTYLILTPDEVTLSITNHLMDFLREKNIEFSIIPPMHNFSVYGVPPRYFFGHDIILFTPSQSRHGPLEFTLKRLLDILGSTTGLLLLSPVFFTIGYLIKKQSPGSSIFFSHKRVGQGGKLFPCYKFTSMVPNAKRVLEDLLASNEDARKEWQRDFKLKNDPRITRIGQKLRSTSLDELPQLWNVLKGDMSLVGPRPIIEEETKYYGKKLPLYLACKPGLTGLWQVSGRNDTSYEYRVHLDAWYAKHWSVWHDIVILFKTVKILVTRSGAY